MKKWYLILLLVLPLSVFAFAFTIDQQQTDHTTIETSIQGTNGTPGSTETAGQSFTTGLGVYKISQIDVWLFKVLAPTGNLRMGVWAASGDSPTGTNAIATSTAIDVTTLTTNTNGAAVSFFFKTPVSVTPNTKYVFKISLRDGTSNDTNFVRVMGSAAGSYSGGVAGQTFGNPEAAWGTDAWDNYFITYGPLSSKNVLNGSMWIVNNSIISIP